MNTILRTPPSALPPDIVEMFGKAPIKVIAARLNCAASTVRLYKKKYKLAGCRVGRPAGGITINVAAWRQRLEPVCAASLEDILAGKAGSNTQIARRMYCSRQNIDQAFPRLRKALANEAQKARTAPAKKSTVQPPAPEATLES